MSSDLGPQLTERTYELIGNYGTFEISKTVRVMGYTDYSEDEWEEAAYAHTGIVMDLEAEGWKFTYGPGGEDWEINHVK